MQLQDQGRQIVHMDLDTFFVSVERLLNSGLKGKPVLIGSLSDRGVVASCSYEARQFGVHSAMPMKMTLRLCQNAIVIRGDMDLYSKHSKLVTDVIASSAPLYEKASIDEHYIDITGMDRFFGAWKWTHELREKIVRETGLPISLGLSVNKTVSKIATGEAKPNGEIQVEKNLVQSFLIPLPIKRIPGIGDKTGHLLRSMGLSTIQTLSMVPVDLMESLLGKNGIDIWQKAHGIDFTPVVPYREEKSISQERTFETDTIDIVMLEQILASMTEKLCFKLRKHEKLTSIVTVKIRYANFDTHSLQRKVAYTSFDHTLINTAKELFKRLYDRRMMVRLIGVKFSGLIHGFQQLSLFDTNEKQVRLYLSMDKIRSKYGYASLQKASAIPFR